VPGGALTRFIVTSWLARWAPALVPATELHHAALRAGLRGKYPAAERLFTRATERYAEDYEPAGILKLRAQRRVFRTIAGDPIRRTTGA
jgi:hypothetical protein